jgi:hypothetical protein
MLAGRQHGDDDIGILGGTAALADDGDATPRAASRCSGDQVEAETAWPALTRLPAIGLPMLPRPMKAMVVIGRSSSLGRE